MNVPTALVLVGIGAALSGYAVASFKPFAYEYASATLIALSAMSYLTAGCLSLTNSNSWEESGSTPNVDGRMEMRAAAELHLGAPPGGPPCSLGGAVPQSL